MHRIFACRWIWMAAAILLTASVLLAPVKAEDSSANDPAQFEAIRLLLDRIEVTLRREGLTVQALYDLGQSAQSGARRSARRIADLEPQLAQLEERVKQLGPPPAKDAAA